ncbi:flagellin [Polynucleobacter sp. SHI8]|uniref:flagellin N-terminal helical domain-containing protein n=1 Tax=unclassified Polynucleobacter TaxID=2640945 RepID=UPI0024910CE5|nr:MULTISPECIES: flagellin [unclassified Polynucleobacter]BDW11746.1 flagellin [Polynucleobacter sp. SHI2]BDW14193.1 flagellin [Polynucleobacter sp. SHI8]
MTLSVNTNVTSLLAQYQLNKTDNSLQASIQRLSSGLRINSAADDASGYAISNRMSSIISGLSTSVRNANDGISYSQTVTGALGSLSDNLQRMRELAIQSLNGDYSNADKGLLEQEYNQLLAENVRIQATTSFNNKAVFNTTCTTIQVGYRNNLQDRISLNSLALTNTTAVSTTRLTETPTTTEAYDLGLVINAAKTTVDGSGQSTATYESVRDATLQALNSADKINTSQKAELTNIVNNLYTTELSINAGVSTYANDLNRLMGASISGAAFVPASPVNASISGASLSTINSIPSISGSISNVLTSAQSAGSVGAAKTIIDGIQNNPYISTTGKTSIANAVTSLYTQYQNSTNVSGFVSNVQNVLLGSNTVTPSSVTMIDGLTSGNRAIEQANAWYTDATPNTMQSVMNDASKNTVSLLQTAFVSSINSSTLDSATKTSLVTAVGNLSTFATNVGMSFGNYKTNLQNLITNGTVSPSGTSVTLSAAGISAIAGTAGSTPNTLIGNAINSATPTYSAIYTAAMMQITNLASSGIISSSVQSNLNTEITNLYNQSNYPSGANTTVPQFNSDMQKLFGIGATGSVGPFSTTTSYQVTGGTNSQLRVVPTGVTSTQNGTTAVNTIDSALNEINIASAQQGAFQNRLTAVINDLRTFSLSQSAAQSRIQDVDFAKETTDLAKNLILSDTGSAMLAQANSTPQAVISLLQSGVPSDSIAANSLLPELFPSGNLGGSGNLMSNGMQLN